MHALASEHKKRVQLANQMHSYPLEGQRNSTSQKEKWEIQCIEETICRISGWLSLVARWELL